MDTVNHKETINEVGNEYYPTFISEMKHTHTYI